MKSFKKESPLNQQGNREPSCIAPQRKQHYECSNTLKIQRLAEETKAQKEQLQQIKHLPPSLQGVIQQKLKAEWTYHSNAIEGSSLSLGQTIFFLQHGITLKGKPLKDFLDAQNHAEAIDYLYDIIREKRPITQSFIKEINALILNGIRYTHAIDPQGNQVRKPTHAGQYKKQPNHVLKPDGNMHEYVEPLQVSVQMEELVEWITEKDANQHTTITAALAHYNMVRIHPFDDGNGRGARILMNLILMKKGYLPAIIDNEQRPTYLEVLDQANQNNLIPFVEFILESLFKTQENILETIKSYKAK